MDDYNSRTEEKEEFVNWKIDYLKLFSQRRTTTIKTKAKTKKVLNRVKVKSSESESSESEVAQSSPTLCDPVDCSPPGSSVHGILQARILEWVAISFSRGIFSTQGSNPGLPHCRQTL